MRKGEAPLPMMTLVKVTVTVSARATSCACEKPAPCCLEATSAAYRSGSGGRCCFDLLGDPVDRKRYEEIASVSAGHQ